MCNANVYGLECFQALQAAFIADGQSCHTHPMPAGQREIPFYQRVLNRMDRILTQRKAAFL